MEILQLYAKASSQCINMDKSSVFFSRNTFPQHRDMIKALLRVSEVGRFESYLGLPTLLGRKKYHNFSFLKDRVWINLQGWKGKTLSRVEKEILIKVVAQSIPTYTIGIFQLPTKLCEELQALCTWFLWGQVGNERKIHWLSWEKLTRQKLERGMGFKDLRQFNLAMLAKQGWRLMQDQESLLFMCLKARYFPRCHFLEATNSPTSSFTWKSILAAKPIIQQGSCWKVGDGASIQVFRDAWIPNHPTNKVLHLTHNVDEDFMIVKIIDLDTRWWDREFIMQNFNKEDVKAILRVPLSKRYILDSMF